MSQDDFSARRQAALASISALGRDVQPGATDRAAFFNAVYHKAGGDAALVPWADLKPKDELARWLAANPGNGRSAIDVACGLGDNAEALAAAGYATTAFDLAEDAITWARQRFPQSPVDYRTGDLLALPPEWNGAFDLVNECYTLQSVPPALLPQMTSAVASLVAPGGTLLVYTRVRPDDAEAAGPPWPLRESEAMAFASLGFTLASRTDIDFRRDGRVIPIRFCAWRKA